MVKKRVLVVDDERDFVDVISERLGAKGFDILRTFDGIRRAGKGAFG